MSTEVHAWEEKDVGARKKSTRIARRENGTKPSSRMLDQMKSNVENDIKRTDKRIKLLKRARRAQRAFNAGPGSHEDIKLDDLKRQLENVQMEQIDLLEEINELSKKNAVLREQKDVCDNAILNLLGLDVIDLDDLSSHPLEDDDDESDSDEE